jgi:hypothetical protein
LGIRRIGKQTFALARKPFEWERKQMPKVLDLKMPYRDAVILASLN